MNVLNKMVLIPEREYQAFKNTTAPQEKPEVKDIDLQQTEPAPEPVQRPEKISVDEYTKSFRAAVKKYNRKVVKKPQKQVNKIKQCQKFNWTTVKNF
jgi:hypothetical protein